MKRLLIGVGLAMGLVQAAGAADMPPGRYMPPPRAPAYVPFFSWSGVYVGFNAGYGFGRSAWTNTTTSATTGSFNVNGVLVGGTLGYNMQLDAWVFGVEGDIAWSNIKGSTATLCLGTCETSTNWLGTARGRVGYGCPGIWNDAQVAGWKPIVNFIKGEGSLAAIQLAHAGRKASTHRAIDGTNPYTAEDAARGMVGWTPVGPTTETNSPASTRSVVAATAV